MMCFIFLNEKNMKKLGYVMMSILIMMSTYSCSSGHYVSAQPEAVVITRPAQPGLNYVWVDGDYYYRGGRYAYRQGYWARPKTGRNWQTGTWMKTPRGYYWRRGGWR